MLATGDGARARPRRGQRQARSPASPRPATTPRPTGSPTRRGSIRGNLVYAYAALRALAAWRPARFTVRLDGDEHELRGLHGGRRQLALTTAAACGSRRRRSRTTACWRWSSSARHSKLRFLANLPKVFSGTHVELDGVRSFRAREVEISADRPFDVYADGEPVDAAARHGHGVVPGAAGDRSAPSESLMLRLKIALARAAGRALPLQPARRRHQPARQAAAAACARTRSSSLAAGLERGSVVVSATNGKTTTAGMIASVLRQAGIATAHNRAGANMPGGVATALLERTRRGRLDGRRSWACSRSTRPGSTTVVEQLRPHTARARQPVPRPARPLRRAGAARRRLGTARGAVASGRACCVLNADDPLVADLGRDRRRRTQHAGVIYFGVEDRSHALPDARARLRRQALPPLRLAVSTTAPPTSATSATTPARAAETRVHSPTCRRDAGRAVGNVGLDASRSTRPRARSSSHLPLPGLYNVYNALAATACCLSLGLALEPDQSRARVVRRRLRARASTSRSGRARSRSC